jgi:signal transduction histidine kinase
MNEHRRLIQEIGVCSLIAVPLMARNRLLGLLTFMYANESGRRFDAADLTLAKALGRRAGRAIDNARLYREAQEAIKLRDEVLAAISHDLQNPLTAIKAHAELLQRLLQHPDRAASDQLAKGVIHISNAAQRMNGMIRELLDVAHLQAGKTLDLKRSRINLVSLVEEIVTEFREIATQPILIEAEASALIGDWDAQRLQRVVDNLISNAIKFSPPLGEITVRLREEDGMAVLAIEDQGVGIPPGALEMIFERFSRAANVIQRVAGHGLGLAGARQIVEQHGGTIQVASQEGIGSTFTVRLPLLQSATS